MNRGETGDIHLAPGVHDGPQHAGRAHRTPGWPRTGRPSNPYIEPQERPVEHVSNYSHFNRGWLHRTKAHVHDTHMPHTPPLPELNSERLPRSGDDHEQTRQ